MGKSLFHLTNLNITEESQGRNSSRDQEVVLLTGLLSQGLLSLLSNSIQDQKSQDGSTHSELAPPISIINQKTPTGQSVWNIFSVESLHF